MLRAAFPSIRQQSSSAKLLRCVWAEALSTSSSSTRGCSGTIVRWGWASFVRAEGRAVGPHYYARSAQTSHPAYCTLAIVCQGHFKVQKSLKALTDLPSAAGCCAFPVPAGRCRALRISSGESMPAVRPTVTPAATEARKQLRHAS